MMGLSEIRAATRHATREASVSRKGPTVPTKAQRRRLAEGELMVRGLSVPFLGDYCPPGWELYDTVFFDMSGWGSPEEPALTQSALARRIAALPPDHGIGMTEHGQFQAYLGLYRPRQPAAA